MNKETVLNNIAKTAYNIGFGGKKHFVTFDMYRILPRLISTITIFIGIIQLTYVYDDEVINANGKELIAAVLICVGILGLILDLLGTDKSKYNLIGKQLIGYYNELADLYAEVSSLDNNDSIDWKAYDDRRSKISQSAQEVSISEQLIFTHWLTHFGFFYSMQSNWVVKELNLTWKDKFPLLHFESLILLVLFLIGLLNIIF